MNMRNTYATSNGAYFRKNPWMTWKVKNLPKFAKLSNQLPTWSDLIHEFMQVDINRKETKSWYKLTKRARCCL